jgi:SWI/SNF-related matrix-associated actin-dependent regulator 1 of chromatin subfamily A
MFENTNIHTATEIFKVNITLLSDKKTFSLKSFYNEELVFNIKKLDDKKYNPSDKTWHLNGYNLYCLISEYKSRKDIFFSFVNSEDKEVFSSKLDFYKRKKIKEDKNKEIIATIDSNLNTFLQSLDEVSEKFDYSKYLKEGVKPYNHQIKGALFANHLKNSLIAADLGTGKTLLAILASEINQSKKVLVIVPSSLKLNWLKEIHHFTNSKAFVLNSKSKLNCYSLEESKYIITNYEYFSRNFDVNKKITSLGLSNVDSIIFDEAHKLKNSKTQMFKNFTKSFKKSLSNTNLMLLTGTPVPNRVQELYNLLKLLRPIEFKSKNKFYTEYCGMFFNNKINTYVQINDNIKFDMIYEKLSKIMFRVKKEDVLKELPPLTINKIYLELTPSEEAEYKRIESGFKDANWDNLSDYKEDKNGNMNISLNEKQKTPLTILTELRQYTSKLKSKYLVEYIERLNEENEKVLIFDCYKSSLKELKTILNNSELYTGDIKSDTRQDIVDIFQGDNNTIQNLLLTVGAGNAGITLTKAKNMFMLSQSYVPAENEQCYARIHRSGQKEHTNVFIFLFSETIDETIYEIINNKLKVINKVVDNIDYIDNSNSSVLAEVINKFKEIYKK